MRLYNNSVEINEKDEKLKKIVSISIVIVLVIIIAIICAILYVMRDPNKITLQINGTTQTNISIMDVEEKEDGSISFKAPIKAIAKSFEYQAYNGSYITTSEDENSCYAEGTSEIVTFTLDSDVIYKIDRTAQDSDYEVCQLDTEITRESDGELYISSEGLQKAFNVSIGWNSKKKLISIYTLDQYVTSLTTENATTGTTPIQDYGYAELDETLANQKAILDDMLVVKSENGKYAVISYLNGEQILGPLYDKITYIPETKVFFIESNGKVGIVSSEGKTKIKTIYDSLSLIDSEKDLYLASSKSLYGVVDIDGNIIIHLDYSQIGIDAQNFTENNITNGYILLDNLIPVQQNGQWGFFDTKGNKITDIIYDNIGCQTSSGQGAAHNLLVIPDYNFMVVSKNEKYGLIDSNAKEIVGCQADDMYMQTSGGETTYYMTKEQNDQTATRDIIDYLENKGYKKTTE